MRKPAPIILRTLADVIKLRSTWARVLDRDSNWNMPIPTVIAFKFSRLGGASHYYPRSKPELVHKVGAALSVVSSNTSPYRSCAEGVNIAPAHWVWNETRYSPCHAAIWQVEFSLVDIAAIPFKTDGKMRVFNAKITHRVSRKKLSNIRKGGNPYMKPARS
jgi:hypothetical protein